MCEFLSDWLALRERVDHASRSLALTRAAVAALPGDRPLRIVDLGSGTGSNVRYLAPLLPYPQRWLTVDRDADLMDGPSVAGVDVERRVMNLGEFDRRIVAGAHLVTASALLDLVSDRWLRELASACRSADTVALFALTYNGHSECAPEESEDDRVRELFNAHQRQSDKGFGTAAGPAAADAAVAAFRNSGFEVRHEPSDWILTPEMRALQRALIDGWAVAAAEIAPTEASAIADWQARRQFHVDAGRSQITVGHVDICATLMRS